MPPVQETTQPDYQSDFESDQKLIEAYKAKHGMLPEVTENTLCWFEWLDGATGERLPESYPFIEIEEFQAESTEPGYISYCHGPALSIPEALPYVLKCLEKAGYHWKHEEGFNTRQFILTGTKYNTCDGRVFDSPLNALKAILLKEDPHA